MVEWLCGGSKWRPARWFSGVAKPVRKIAEASRCAPLRASIGTYAPYTIRHTIETELAARGVPGLDIAALMAHRMTLAAER